MRTFEEYRALIGGRKNKTIEQVYKYMPKDKTELIDAIDEELKLQGPEADLNCIDTSEITEMSHLFAYKIYRNFCGDVSRWNMSNVTNISNMFYKCAKFNCDISGWDVSNVEDMNSTFYGCEKFDQDLGPWDVSKVMDMSYMFNNCKSFDHDLSQWNVSNAKFKNGMFTKCPIKEEHKPKFNI